MNCGGRLEGRMNFCPFCGVRQDIDLRQIHFRDLGSNPSMPCPHCEETALGVVVFDLDPQVTIERCQVCYGMFFNPGELEYLLEAHINPLVWLDIEGLNQITADFGHDHELIYRKCPTCAERMSHINFGGRSGVILDQCGTHGVWLDGGELRRLAEWWRAGGKLLHQQHQAERAKSLYGRPLSAKRREKGSIDWNERPKRDTWMIPDGTPNGGVLGRVMESILDLIIP